MMPLASSSHAKRDGAKCAHGKHDIKITKKIKKHEKIPNHHLDIAHHSHRHLRPKREERYGCAIGV